MADYPTVELKKSKTDRHAPTSSNRSPLLKFWQLVFTQGSSAWTFGTIVSVTVILILNIEINFLSYSK